VLAVPGLVRACYDGRPGHPVVLGGSELALVAGLQGDHGARSLLAGARLVECGDICSDADVDTPADLALLSAACRAPAASSP
jgi:CTP:molybdopterin cytidylyltransferase MocA